MNGRSRETKQRLKQKQGLETRKRENEERAIT